MWASPAPALRPRSTPAPPQPPPPGPLRRYRRRSSRPLGRPSTGPLFLPFPNASGAARVNLAVCGRNDPTRPWSTRRRCRRSYHGTWSTNSGCDTWIAVRRRCRRPARAAAGWPGRSPSGSATSRRPWTASSERPEARPSSATLVLATSWRPAEVHPKSGARRSASTNSTVSVSGACSRAALRTACSFWNLGIVERATEWRAGFQGAYGNLPVTSTVANSTTVRYNALCPIRENARQVSCGAGRTPTSLWRLWRPEHGPRRCASILSGSRRPSD